MGHTNIKEAHHSNSDACMQICLIMDEVDGMSGGDRGGVSELIQSIHRSKVPIICICNDKYNQKLRSLRNHTLELDYRSGSLLLGSRSIAHKFKSLRHTLQLGRLDMLPSRMWLSAG